MTDKDEMAVRGEMMSEYRENEAKLATRRNLLAKHGKQLQHVGEALQRSDVGRIQIETAEVLTPPTAPHARDGQVVPRNVFDLAEMATLLNDVRTLTVRQSELRPQLKAIGFLD